MRRRTDLEDRERNEPKDIVRLKVQRAEVLSVRAKELVEGTAPKIARFQQAIEEADRYAAFAFANSRAALTSPQLLAYCDVENVAKQVPQLVRSGAEPRRTIEIGENFADDLPADVFISGPAGFGKTSFCKWQTLHDLQSLRDNKSDIIPIYVPLHQYAEFSITSFEATFIRSADLLGLWETRRPTPNGAPVRRFRLYLDGLDEVPSADRQRELLHTAISGKTAEPTLQFVVTGRDHVVGTHLHHFPRIRVSEFDEKKVRELVTKWFENDSRAVDEFFTKMAKVPNLLPLMRVPLLATLIIGVYRNTRTFPESRVRLYEMFLNLLAGGWDAAKNIHRQTEFGPTPKLAVLVRLAAVLHIGRRRDCNQLDFKSAVRSTLPGLSDKWQKLLAEVIQDGLLVPTGLTYAFAHLSFQEFLAARDLFEPSGRKATQAIRAFLVGDQWWREVVTFYVGMAAKPQETADFIHSIAEKAIAKTADPSTVGRAHYILETLTQAFPGARPNFKFRDRNQP